MPVISMPSQNPIPDLIPSVFKAFFNQGMELLGSGHVSRIETPSHFFPSSVRYSHILMGASS